MKPGDRIDVITRCADSLAGKGYTHIDFVLREFSLNIWDESDTRTFDNQFDYVRAMLGSSYADDKDILALDDYLNGHYTYDEQDEPWDKGCQCRVFITHLATQRKTASAVQAQLRWWGVDGFVAHQDIDPGAEWVRVILAALQSCDALIALMHEGFGMSKWCDQEVGYAFGRKVPVIPVQIDFPPYGFLGLFQAIPWPKYGKPEGVVARNVVKTLLANKSTSEAAVAAVVAQLCQSSSYEQANSLSTTLAESPALVTKEQLAMLRTAQKENFRVSRGYNVEPALRVLESRLEPATPAPIVAVPAPYSVYDYGEEPF
jgi:hypothetical protein